MWSKIADWFLETPVWKWIAINVLSKYNVRFSGYTKFDMTVLEKMKEEVYSNPNRVFAVVGGDPNSYAFKAQNLIKKCMYGHAGVVVPNDRGTLDLVHMEHDGLLIWDLANYLKCVDRAALLELPIKPENVAKSKHRLETLLKWRERVSYDFGLDLSKDVADLLDMGIVNKDTRIYCSEEVFLMGVGLVDTQHFKERWQHGKAVFTPDDLYNSCRLLISFDGTV